MAEFAADDFSFIAKRQREIQADIAREVGCDIKPTEQVTPTAPEGDAAKPATTPITTGSGGGFKTPTGDDYWPDEWGMCGYVDLRELEFERILNGG